MCLYIHTHMMPCILLIAKIRKHSINCNQFYNTTANSNKS